MVTCLHVGVPGQGFSVDMPYFALLHIIHPLPAWGCHAEHGHFQYMEKYEYHMSKYLTPAGLEFSAEIILCFVVIIRFYHHHGYCYHCYPFRLCVQSIL